MQLALFGIDNDALNLTVNLLVVFLVMVWIALIAWTFLDARRRMEDPVLVACATAASFIPFVGTVIYAILRPPEFTEDRHERELEIRAAELRVRQLTEQSCPKCEYPIEKAFLRCPNCQSRVKDPCPSCEKPIDPRWSMCPYCETALRREPPKRPAPERRPRREPQRERPQRERPARAKSSPAPTKSPPAPKKRAAPKRETPEREKRQAPERERDRVAAASQARRTRAKTAKGKSTVDEPTAEHRFEGDSGDESPPRPAPAS
jgi:Double zinc ribbon